MGGAHRVSLRTGIERIATVIRGAGWLLAFGSLAVGIVAGIGEGWQYRWEDAPLVSQGSSLKNPFDAFDDPKSKAAQGQSNKTETGPWTDYQKKDGPRTFSFEEAQRDGAAGPTLFEDLVPKKKQFQLESVQFGYMLIGLAFGAALLGLAYVFAWVLVGFAPGT